MQVLKQTDGELLLVRRPWLSWLMSLGSLVLGTVSQTAVSFASLSLSRFHSVGVSLSRFIVVFIITLSPVSLLSLHYRRGGVHDAIQLLLLLGFRGGRAAEL
jgi:hypothetical protein